MDAHAIVASTQDPAFAVGVRGTILAWNSAAEKLLGHGESQVLERSCWEILSGRDVFGNDYCGDGCPLIWMAERHRAISRCELCFRGGSGEFQHVGVATMVVPGIDDSELALVHLLTPVVSDSPCEESFPWRLYASQASSRLTERESQVLALLADGKGTTEIAELLFITTATVQNHIKRILGKLKVHSRLEAVSLARRIGLLESLKHDR